MIPAVVPVVSLAVLILSGCKGKEKGQEAKPAFSPLATSTPAEKPKKAQAKKDDKASSPVNATAAATALPQKPQTSSTIETGSQTQGNGLSRDESQAALNHPALDVQMLGAKSPNASCQVLMAYIERMDKEIANQRRDRGYADPVVEGLRSAAFENLKKRDIEYWLAEAAMKHPALDVQMLGAKSPSAEVEALRTYIERMDQEIVNQRKIRGYADPVVEGLRKAAYGNLKDRKLTRDESHAVLNHPALDVQMLGAKSPNASCQVLMAYIDKMDKEIVNQRRDRGNADPVVEGLRSAAFENLKKRDIEYWLAEAAMKHPALDVQMLGAKSPSAEVGTLRAYIERMDKEIVNQRRERGYADPVVEGLRKAAYENLKSRTV